MGDTDPTNFSPRNSLGKYKVEGTQFMSLRKEKLSRPALTQGEKNHLLAVGNGATDPSGIQEGLVGRGGESSRSGKTKPSRRRWTASFRGSPDFKGEE